MIIIERPIVTLDLIDIADSIAISYNLVRAKAFIHSAKQTFSQLAKMPLIGSPRPEYSPEISEIRQWRVKRFEDYLIFYFPLDDENGVEIVRVIHGKRNIPLILEDEKA